MRMMMEGGSSENQSRGKEVIAQGCKRERKREKEIRSKKERREQRKGDEDRKSTRAKSVLRGSSIATNERQEK